MNAALTPIIIYFAHRYRWYDELDHRKIHTEDTPRIGGIGILVGFLAAVIAALIMGASSSMPLPSAVGDDATVGRLLLFFLPALAGMTLMHLLGLIDDFRNLRPVGKLLVQLVAATLVTIGPFRIENLTIPFVWYQLELGLFSYPVTILWIVAVSNALNFIDGVDGLAGGTAAIATLFFAIIALVSGHAITALLAVGLFGTTLGFLLYNAPPAKIFMGDSGSYLLGYVLSVFPLMLINETRVSLHLIPSATILAVPLLDMVTSVFRRLARGKHPFSADRDHLHHKLMDLGNGTWRILAIAYAASVCLGVVGVLWYVVPPGPGTIIAVAAWVVLIALVVFMARTRRRLVGESSR
ncbi:MAG: MraY family glycosyltransferase [Spirochaetales bacterium]